MHCLTICSQPHCFELMSPLLVMLFIGLLRLPTLSPTLFSSTFRNVLVYAQHLNSSFKDDPSNSRLQGLRKRVLWYVNFGSINADAGFIVQAVLALRLSCRFGVRAWLAWWPPMLPWAPGMSGSFVSAGCILMDLSGRICAIMPGVSSVQLTRLTYSRAIYHTCLYHHCRPSLPSRWCLTCQGLCLTIQLICIAVNIFFVMQTILAFYMVNITCQQWHVVHSSD